MDDGDAVEGEALRAPVFREYAPQHLVVILTVPEEGAAQHSFLDRADLAEGAVAAAVGHRQ